MASSAKKWAVFVSYICGRMYFYLIILQVPLFRVPCRAGICKTPLEVTACPLLATEACPPAVVKALLYPGAVVHSILKGKTIPSFNNLLKTYPNFNKLKHFDATIDLQRIEVLVGSYFSVAGALLGFLLRPGRMSLVGTLLILLGLTKELFLGKHVQMSSRKAVSVHPTMLIAPVLAFLSIKSDVRKLIRCFKSKRHSKAKYN